MVYYSDCREIKHWNAADWNWKPVKPKCVFDPVGHWCMTHHIPEITCRAMREDE